MTGSSSAYVTLTIYTYQRQRATCMTEIAIHSRLDNVIALNLKNNDYSKPLREQLKSTCENYERKISIKDLDRGNFYDWRGVKLK